MRAVKVLLLCGTLVLSLSVLVMAEPKGPNGEKCDSSETGAKHDIKGKTYTYDKVYFRNAIRAAVR
jgi:hypothetical protein